MKKSHLVLGIVAALGTEMAQATIYNINFSNSTFFGSNADVVGSVDTSTGTGAFHNAGATGPLDAWTATVIGTYTALDGAKGSASMNSTDWSFTTSDGATSTGICSYTLESGQVAMALLFDWNGNIGIPIINFIEADGSAVDGDGDGNDGVAFKSGILVGTQISFSASAVPVPGTVWLMGSGLLSLAGIARRRYSGK